VDFQASAPSSAEDVAAVCRQVVSGSSLVRLSGFDWRVLKATGHQALLLADRVVGAGPYHQEQAGVQAVSVLWGVTWERCDLRRWLNGQFLGSLGKPLASRVLRTKVVNGPIPVHGTRGGRDTEDQLFLLSLEEAADWLTGERFSREEYHDFGGIGSGRLIAKNEDGGSVWWWLRSPGGDPGYAAYVLPDGRVLDRGGSVHVSSGGVRPAFWLDIASHLDAGPQVASQSPARTASTRRPAVRLGRLKGIVDYQTRPPSPAAEVVAGCRRVASGSSLVRLSGIDWRVLKVTGHRALLLADRVIGTGPYHQVEADVTWEQCDLRQWLNGEFLDSLGRPLASQVLRTKVANRPNPAYGTPGCEDTEDWLFLLSLEEAADWLAGKRPRWKKYRDGNWLKSVRLIAKGEDGYDVWWWLRSPGRNPDYAANVLTVGSLYGHGNSVSASSGGVRPAFWLNLEP
jgi:hypothetical protein